MGDFVALEYNGGRADVIIKHPPVNALSVQVYAELLAAFTEVAVNEEINVVVFRGEGRAFSAGRDMHDSRAADTEDLASRRKVIVDCQDALFDIPVPVVCVIHGFAIGGAVPLICLADIRLASSDAFISMPEVNLMRGAGGGYPMMRIGVPMGKVREICYTGRRVPATEALQIGLFDDVFEPFELNTGVDKLCQALVEKPRLALVDLKRTANAVEVVTDWRQAHIVSEQVSLKIAATDEARKAAANFFQKK